MAVNVCSLLLVGFHAITWFNLAPQALVVRFGHRHVPGSADCRHPTTRRGSWCRRSSRGSLSGAEMIKRSAEPLLWMMFSAGGVVAALVLPMLLFLFGVAFPLGWLTPPPLARLAAVIGSSTHAPRARRRLHRVALPRARTASATRSTMVFRSSISTS